MKHNPSWISLLHTHNNLWKNKTDPMLTERFLNQIENSKEVWEAPIDDFVFARYKWRQYTINKDWVVKDLSWHPMKYIFHIGKLWPRILIRRERKKINETSFHDEYHEIALTKLMRKYFWCYIDWYHEAKLQPQKFILIPKDWDRNNISVKNLRYISIKEYKEIWTKKANIKNILLFNPKKTDKEIEQSFGYSRPHISKVRREMWSEWKLKEELDLEKLRKELWIQIYKQDLQVYQILKESNWKLSNSEIAQILWPEKYSAAKSNIEKKNITMVISRIRKKLTDKWIIPRFNETFEKHRNKAIEMIKDKPNSQMTNKEIAEVLWLKKDQIDNLVRQIKKEESNKN